MPLDDVIHLYEPDTPVCLWHFSYRYLTKIWYKDKSSHMKGHATTTKTSLWNEPRHDKTNKMNVHPAKTQISLGIRPVWSESSLPARRKLGSLATHWAHCEDSDQTGRMPRLIWVFAGRTLIMLVLSCRGADQTGKQTWKTLYELWCLTVSMTPVWSLKCLGAKFGLCIEGEVFPHTWEDINPEIKCSQMPSPLCVLLHTNYKHCQKKKKKKTFIDYLRWKKSNNFSPCL